MTGLYTFKVNTVMCCRMRNSRAYYMAGVRLCADCSIADCLDTMLD